jgi:hypothetical protein
MTPEEEAEEARLQELRRASFTRARLTPEERAVARGAVMEEIARAQIDNMTAARAEGHNVSTRGGANLGMVARANATLAHALASQGRFREAAEIHPLKRMAAKYLKTAEAVEKGDELCECEREVKTDPLTQKKIEISPRRAIREIYSRTHGALVALTRCESCGDLNAVPVGGQAAQIVEAVRGSTRARRATTNDAQALGKR